MAPLVENACYEMVVSSREWRDGVLTTAEYREKLKQADEQAQQADHPEIAASIRDLLREVTQRADDTEVIELQDRAAQACLDAGFGDEDSEGG